MYATITAARTDSRRVGLYRSAGKWAEVGSCPLSRAVTGEYRNEFVVEGEEPRVAPVFEVFWNRELSKSLTLLVRREAGQLHAEVEELADCSVSADTLDELVKQAVSAVRMHGYMVSDTPFQIRLALTP